MIINARYFYSLPRKLQAEIMTAAKETQDYWQKISKDTAAEIIGKFQARGMAVSYPDLAPFTQIARSIYPQFAERVGGMERIQAVQAVK